MSTSFTSPLPGMCKVCGGKIDSGELIQDIKVPGHSLTRWAHDACAIRVEKGLLAWNGQYFAPVTKPAAGAASTPAPAKTDGGGGLFAADEDEEASKLEKRRAFMADKGTEIVKQGFVCRVGAAPVPGDDIWIYGGEVNGKGMSLSSWLEAPGSQFSGQGEADAAAVREISEKLLAARDKVRDKDDRAALADMLTEMNSLGQGKTGEAAASTQSQTESTESAPTVETGPASSEAESTGKEQGDAPKKRGRKPKAKPGEAGEQNAGESTEAAPNTTPEPQNDRSGIPGEDPTVHQPVNLGDDSQAFDGHSEEPGYDPLLLAFDQRVAKIVKMVVGQMNLAAPAASPELYLSKAAPRSPLDVRVALPSVRHEKFDLVLQLARARQNILLVGPSQSGKTTMAEQIAEALGLPFYSFGCSVGMTESVIKGRFVPTGEGGRFEWEPSGFVTAFEGGGVCLVDEIDAAASDVAIVMNAPLSNNWMSVESRMSKPRAEKHPDFICIASANTFGHGADRMYVGRQQLDFATLMRFDIGQVEIGYSEAIENVLCPDAALRGMLQSVRNAIDVLNRAAPFSIKRAVGTSFLKKAYEMRRDFNWDDAAILKQLFCGWSRAEIDRVQTVVDAGGKLPDSE